MDMEQIRSLSGENLKAEQAKVAEQLFRIRFAKSLGKQDGIGKIRSLKKDIARMKTLQREQALTQAKAGN